MTTYEKSFADCMNFNTINEPLLAHILRTPTNAPTAGVSLEAIKQFTDACKDTRYKLLALTTYAKRLPVHKQVFFVTYLIGDHVARDSRYDTNAIADLNRYVIGNNALIDIARDCFTDEVVEVLRAYLLAQQYRLR